jgi:hypothetical protein
VGSFGNAIDCRFDPVGCVVGRVGSPVHGTMRTGEGAVQRRFAGKFIVARRRSVGGCCDFHGNSPVWTLEISGKSEEHPTCGLDRGQDAAWMARTYAAAAVFFGA